MGKQVSACLRFLRNGLLCVALTAGLLPVLPVFSSAEAAEPDSAASGLSGDYAEGQALVVYHTGLDVSSEGAQAYNRDEGGAWGEAAPLAELGFTVDTTWDLSAADESAAAVRAADDGAVAALSAFGEAPATDDPATVAASEDVRIALVSKDGLTTENLIDQLSALDFVEVAGPNYYYQTSSLNDTYYGMQHSLTSESAGISYETVYGSEPVGDEAVLAILDTGVDYTNPDLVDHMWSNPGNLGIGAAGTHGYNAYDNNNDPMPGSTLGASHGTHCAGIAAAKSNNNEGIAGVSGASSQVKIMGLRVTDSQGGAFLGSSIASCYEYLVRAKLSGVNVVAVNNSWGGSFFSVYDPVLDYLVNQAGKAGVLSLFAAGNDGMTAAEQFNTVMLESPYAIMVAASNEQNELASFSNFEKTAVDVAAPGTKVLSTIANSCRTSFNALLSYRAGKALEYYSDIASAATSTTSGFSLNLVDADGMVLGPDAQKALTREVAPSTTETQLGGEPAVKITIDYDKLKAALVGTDTDYATCKARLTWTADNPFYGKTATASDYTAHVSIASSDKSPEILSDTQTGRAAPGLITSTGENLVALYNAESESYAARSSVSRDNSGIAGGVLSDTAASEKTLTAQVDVFFEDSGADESGNVKLEGDLTCLVSGFGVGKNTNPSTDSTSAAVPYGYMSGTSMATPTITGVVAELAVLYPTESALQLRGRICGGTASLQPDSGDRHIASDGRFTFDVAASDRLLPTTWSLTAEGANLTLHGRALEGAALVVDGNAASPISQTDDAITFEADATLLDGKMHSFDVSLNGRTYWASYRTPSASQSDNLVSAGDLPIVDQAAAGTLVSSSDRLFFADGKGSYLYSTVDPSKGADSWASLSTPGVPWTEAPSANRLGLTYAYADGLLYAFSADAKKGDATKAVIYCAVYDIRLDAWSDFAPILEVRADALGKIQATASDGRMCVMVATTETSNGSSAFGEMTASLYLASSEVGSRDFSTQTMVLPADDGMRTLNPFALQTVDGELRCLAFWEEVNSSSIAPSGLAIARFDTATQSWVSTGRIAEVPLEEDPIKQAGYMSGSSVAAGNGVMIAGNRWDGSEKDATGLGDAQFYFVDDAGAGHAVSLGSFGFGAADGMSVSGAAMFDGVVYLNCANGNPDADRSDVALYTLPQASAEKLASTDAIVSVSSQEGGSARVSDWRADAASAISTTSFSASTDSSQLKVRSGDKVTWTATADAGYSFAGWYDADGVLVSQDATYAARPVADRALTAHFEKGADPIPSPSNDQGSQAKRLVSTGDSTLPFVLFAVALGAGVLAIALRRRNLA